MPIKPFNLTKPSGPVEYYLASDPSAIIEHTRRVLYLEDGDLVHLRKEGTPRGKPSRLARSAMAEPRHIPRFDGTASCRAAYQPWLAAVRQHLVDPCHPDHRDGAR